MSDLILELNASYPLYLYPKAIPVPSEGPARWEHGGTAVPLCLQLLLAVL